jgi:hypothetical protein
MLSPGVRDKVLHPYKTTGNILFGLNAYLYAFHPAVCSVYVRVYNVIYILVTFVC